MMDSIKKWASALRYHAWALVALSLSFFFAQFCTLTQQVPLAAINNDTPSYTQVVDNLNRSFWQGLVEPFRTAGYPLFLSLVRHFAQTPLADMYCHPTDPHIAACNQAWIPYVFAQAIVYGITVLEIYVLAYWLTHRRLVASFATIVATCNLYMYSWERELGTELLSFWALVTVMLFFVHFMRHPTVRWGMALGVILFVSVMIRPFNEFVPPVLAVLALGRAIWAHGRAGLRTYWKSTLAMLLVVYSLIFSYSQLNGHINGVYDISYVTNINLFVKVYEYRMQGEPAPAQYATIQAETSDWIAAHGSVAPFNFFNALIAEGKMPSSPDYHYDEWGAFSKYIILHDPVTFALRSLPDIYRTWIITDYALYPDYGYGQTYLQPNQWIPYLQPGITSYDTLEGTVPASVQPPWTNVWLLLSTLEELSFVLLPIVLIGSLLWLRRRPNGEVSFYILVFASLALLAILVSAVGSSGSFERLRFPGEWAMYLANILVGIYLFDALKARSVTRRGGGSVAALALAGPESAGTEVTMRETVPASATAGVHESEGGLQDGEPLVAALKPVVAGTHPERTDRAVVILGAGPAGLTAAYELTRHGVPALVLEMDPTFVGGISRTEERGGYRFDIGGHRFFSKSQEIEDFWTEVAGDLLLTRGRLSRIYYQGKYFAYPLKATNALWNLGPIETLRCMSSYAWARLFPVRNPRTFEDWVCNQFGSRLFSIFFKTYTEKVWGISTRELSADWAAQRIKGLDLGAAIKSALPISQKTRKDRGAVIKTLIDEFRYPRLGPGQLWERVRDRLLASGQQVEMGQQVVAVNHSDGRVTSVRMRDIQTGEERTVGGTDFISTLPIRELVNRMDPPLPEPVVAAANSLKYRDFLTVALIIDRAAVFPDNWIYIHDPSVQVGRIQNFKNWSPEMVPDPGTTCLGLEYFCFAGDGLWDSSDKGLVGLASREVVQLGMCRAGDVLGGVVVRQPKAYPVYDDEYKQHLAVIRDYLAEHLPNVQLVGRNGMHHYNNQDHSMMTALLVARNIATGTHFDPWKVNTDAEYHEEARLDEEDTSGRLVPARIPSLSHVEK